MDKPKNLNEMWLHSCHTNSSKIALGVRHSSTVKDAEGKITEESFFKTFTYLDIEKEVQALGAGLGAIGVKEQDSIVVIAENSMEWLIADLAVHGNRAYNVPRGITSTTDELTYILTHSEAKIAFVQDERELQRMKKLRDELPLLETIIVLSREYTQSEVDNGIYSFEQIMEKGVSPEALSLFKKRRSETAPDDIATLIYTSGTTGVPKGIPLTHANLMHNIINTPPLGNFNSSDKFLSILPIWHIFERSFEYMELSVGASIWYTSKLTLLKDLQEVKPSFMASVPRIWLSVYNGVITSLKNKGKLQLFEKMFVHSLKVVKAKRYKEGRQYLLIGETPRKEKASLLDHIYHGIANKLIYSKIRAKVGGAFKAGISGGGSLPGYIDDFFEVIGVALLEGYGLTETSPILTARTFEHRIPYTAGQPLEGTTLRILDEDGKEITDSGKGIIWANGPQVMKGYYKNEEETQRVMTVDSDGRRWFNTGDIGRRTADGDIAIIGRDKDTIVLLGGENIEPEPLERQLLSSSYLDQVMVCGQDQEFLTVLIVPNQDALKDMCTQADVPFLKEDIAETCRHEKIRKQLEAEIAEIISEENGFKDIEQIHNFCCTEPFSPDDNTLTQTFKVKRFNVQIRDYERIKSMYPHYNESRKE